MKFDTQVLKTEIIENLDSLGYNEMTPIQEMSLPHILGGKDLIGQAKTGSGKTAAFGLGILNKLDLNHSTPQGLILCPTRELAEQVAGELRKLARFTSNIKILAITGGTNEGHQLKSLEHGAHLVVGTPGRIFKFLKEDKITFDKLHSFVLDEADRMLDMGFYDSIEKIERYLPKERQTLLFSATFPYAIEDLSKNLQEYPEFVKIDTSHEKNEIEQFFYEVESHKDKDKYVAKLLGKYQPDSAIVFCKTKLICDAVAKSLQKQGISALPLHGDHDQRDRTLTLTKFANGSCVVLIATDVAARGLDIKDLAMVINLDLSPDPEVYVHRIGRTGRIGNTGMAASLYVEAEQYKLDDIVDYLGQKLNFRDVSSLNETVEFELAPKMETLFISGGKKDKLRPGDIVGAIIGTSGIDAKFIGDINVLNVLSYVAVDCSVVDIVLKGLQEGKIKKRNFRVGLA